MVIRETTSEDARAIAEIHVRSWQAAYRSIVPDAYLESLSVDERERTWRRNLAQRTSDTWVAEDSGDVLGWISVGRSRDPDARSSTGEVWALYVAPAHWRRGVGRFLWREAEGQLKASGFSEVTLWVLKDNAPALAFYKSIGFDVEPGPKRTITRGVALLEVRMRKALTVGPRL